ncbi:MAG: TonB-dependent receptor [Saprospiraceae bacterium]
MSDIYRKTKRNGATIVLDYRLKDGNIFFKNFYNRGYTDVTRYNENYNLTNSSRSFGHETYKEEYINTSNSYILSFNKKLNKLLIQSDVSFMQSQKEVPTNFSFIFDQRNAIKSEVLNSVIPPEDLTKYTNANDSISYLETINEIENQTQEMQKSVNVDLTYTWALSDKIYGNLKVGGKYQGKERSNDKFHYFGRLRLNSGQQAKDAILNAYPEMQNIAQLGTSSLPFEIFSNKSFNHGDFLHGEYTMGAVAESSFLSDVLRIIKENVGEDEFQTYSLHQYYTEREDYEGSENLYAGYAMSEIHFGKKIMFIPGWRYEDNTTKYTGPYGDATATAFPDQDYAHRDTSVTRHNAFLLPMMHVRFKPFEWFDVRLAYTHTLSRPSFYQFTPRLDILNEAVILNNSTLKPEFSKNIDIYLSFHNSKLGLFTAGTFLKRIDNMIFSLDRRVILDPNEYGLPSETKGRVIFTQANNDKVASLNGFELDWQTHFWYLPGLLQGLILNINYTHIYSEADYPRTVIELGPIDPVTFTRPQYNIDSYLTDRLIDQPNDIFNIQIGYDYKGFSGRISTLYQSKIFKGTNYYPELVQFTESYNRWDISLKQALPWKGFKVFININNVSNASDRSRIVGAPWNTRIQEYGRTFDVGLRYEI